MFHRDLLGSLGNWCSVRRGRSGKSVAELGIRLGDLTWRNGEMEKTCSQFMCFSRQGGLWVPKEFLLEVKTGTKQWVEVKKFGWEYLCDPLDGGSPQ